MVAFVLANVCFCCFKARFGGLGEFFHLKSTSCSYETGRFDSECAECGSLSGAMQEGEVKCDVHSVRRSLAGLPCPTRVAISMQSSCVSSLSCGARFTRVNADRTRFYKRRKIQQLVT